jgi:RNA polymerase-binding transcription factor DksA
VIKDRPPGYGRFKRNISIPRIRRALQKIADGTYGYCEGEDCEKRIPDERLQSIPAALLCLECQQAFEENQ